MNYEVKLYKNSKFYNGNTPDSTVLRGLPYITKTAVNSVQNRFLSSITLKLTEEESRDIDYCVIGDFNYYVVGITGKNHDTFELQLEPDYLGSLGVENLDILDGLTERHHVKDDSFGLYTEEDEMMITTQPLIIPAMKIFRLVPSDEQASDPEADQYYNFIESTIDLNDLANEQSARTFTDNETGESVTIPSVKPCEEGTEYGIRQKVPDTIYDYAYFKLSKVNGSRLYQNNDTVLEGVQKARDIGVENSVLRQYSIPKLCVGNIEEEDGGVKKLTGKIAKLEWINAIPEGLKFYYKNEGYQNTRILYGSNSQYCLMTSTGNIKMFKPEEIMPIDREIVPGSTPDIYMITDPRPKGKPYFRFEYWLGRKIPEAVIGQEAQVWSAIQNTIAGSVWNDIPLVYTEKSGNVLDEITFQNERSVKAINRYAENEMYQYNRRLNSIGTVTGAYLNPGIASYTANYQNMPINTSYNQINTPRYIDMTANYSPQGIANTTGGIFSGLQKMINSAANEGLAQEVYNLDEYNQLMKYAYSQTIAPDLRFPFNSDFTRDIMRNGVIVYRYTPTDNDLRLQDRILTMYGYKHTDIVKKEYFFNRRNYNFLKLKTITIKNDIPTWFKAGITKQLLEGIRIWHVQPDDITLHYNPIKEEETEEND